MKKMIVRFFAVIGFLVTLSLVGGGYCLWHMASHSKKTQMPESVILTIDLGKPIVERDAGSPLSMAMHFDEETTPLADVVRAIERAKDDKRVKAVVVRFGAEQPSLVHAQEIRTALEHFNKQQDKLSYAFAPSYGNFGMGNKSYYLASAFKEIWLQPVGTVGLTSIGFEAPFGKTALENFGVSTDFFQREEYKSAMEEYTRDSFSAPARADLENMLKSLNDQIAVGVATSRGWEVAKVAELMAQGPYTATEALQHQIVTRLGYEDEIFQEIEKSAGDKTKQMDLYSYLDASEKTSTPKATVALITGEGMITDTPSGTHHLTEDHVMDADTLAAAFHDAVEDKDVKAIIFRVDSPGGSPVASETIRHALIRAKAAHKPVFVSMGEVAASGGYWVAMDADHIVASPATLTGSIGVVAGKYVIGGLWQKLGVKWDRMETGDNAHLWSTLEPYNAQGRERMNALVDETYQAFISNVSAARKIPIEKMAEVAKGRVWTGEQALKVGLVDELGGLATTVLAVKHQLKLEPTDPIELVNFPEEPSFVEALLKTFKTVGSGGIAFHNLLTEWRGFDTRLAPLREALVPQRMPASAQMPSSVAGAGR